jgi:transcription initiation factor TFIID TATA-box-binding protein
MIVNVVATASLNQKVNFDELDKQKEIFHDSHVYRGKVAYFKTMKMEGKVSIFSSGKMISVGTRSEKRAFKELQSTMTFLAEKGLAKRTKLDPKTRNVVITADFGKSLNLEKLAEDTKAIYEPDQFPGAILRFDKPFKSSVLVFASGKTVITGLTDSSQIEPTTSKLKRLIEVDQ